MSGTLVETIYSVHPETEEIREEFATTYKPWQISFMSDELGLHKISNGSPDTGAVSLHLYTPPFNSCKVRHGWALGHRARLAARAQPLHPERATPADPRRPRPEQVWAKSGAGELARYQVRRPRVQGAPALVRRPRPRGSIALGESQMSNICTI